MVLSNYILLCDSLVTLLHPLVEIVIHDVESDKILYIKGSLTKRQVGDPSLLDANLLSQQDIDKIVYLKINFDGRLVKSISIPLENKWLICINFDISLFNQMKEIGDIFLKLSSEHQQQSLFKNDWQEKIHKAINDYLQKTSLKFERLSRVDKKLLVLHLSELGAFNQKNAADYVAKVLNLGRATVFKYLKEGRNQ